MSRRKTTDEFILDAREVYGDRYVYDYVDYKANNIKVSIVCKIHGSFDIRPSDHLNGQGCSACGGTKRKTTSEFICDAVTVHNNFYDYSLVNYKNNRSKVKIICQYHGVFLQKPDDHLRGNGCPVCSGNVKLSFESFCLKSKTIHGDKYDYSNANYVNNSTKVEIICSKHGSFWQTPSNHFAGKGCNKCALIFSSDDIKSIVRKRHVTMKRNGTYGTSRPENRMYNLLVEKFGKHDVVRQYSSDFYPFKCDFYVVSKDFYIEYNGHWTHNTHFYNPSNKDDVKVLLNWIVKAKTSKFYKNAVEVWSKRDVLKLNYAQMNDLNYFVFWDRDLTDFNIWLDSI